VTEPIAAATAAAVSASGAGLALEHAMITSGSPGWARAVPGDPRIDTTPTPRPPRPLH